MQSEIPDDVMETAKDVVDRMPTHAFKGDAVADVAQAIMAHAALSAADPSVAVKAPYENDAIWARFYRDGKNLGEICAEFKCGVYDLSPWLTAPLLRSALTAQVQDVAVPDGWQLVPKEPTEEMIAEACSSAPHVIISYTKPEERDGTIPLIPLATWRAMLAAAPAKQEGKQ